jgi:hypothetical protein
MVIVRFTITRTANSTPKQEMDHLMTVDVNIGASKRKLHRNMFRRMAVPFDLAPEL